MYILPPLTGHFDVASIMFILQPCLGRKKKKSRKKGREEEREGGRKEEVREEGRKEGKKEIDYYKE